MSSRGSLGPAEIAKFDRDTKLIYEKDMITERDYQNIIDTAAENSRAEGFAEGLAEGKVLIAKAMIAKGMDRNTISEITGLSDEELESL